MVINYYIVERIIVFIVSDNQICVIALIFDMAHILFFNDENVSEVKEVQFVVERVRICVHSAMPYRTFTIRAMIILALFGIFSIFM